MNMPYSFKHLDQLTTLTPNGTCICYSRGWDLMRFVVVMGLMEDILHQVGYAKRWNKMLVIYQINWCKNFFINRITTTVFHFGFCPYLLVFVAWWIAVLLYQTLSPSNADDTVHGHVVNFNTVLHHAPAMMERTRGETAAAPPLWQGPNFQNIKTSTFGGVAPQCSSCPLPHQTCRLQPSNTSPLTVGDARTET